MIVVGLWGTKKCTATVRSEHRTSCFRTQPWWHPSDEVVLQENVAQPSQGIRQHTNQGVGTKICILKHIGIDALQEVIGNGARNCVRLEPELP